MKYAMCPYCGKKLFKGESGTRVELECPKCGRIMLVMIEKENLQIINKQNEYTKLKDNLSY